MIDALFTTSATISNAGTPTTDSEGVSTNTPGTTATVCHFQPRRSDEIDQGADVAPAEWTAWFYPDITITPRSTVTIAGEVYVVHGEPARWSVGDPNDHIEAILRRSV